MTATVNISSSATTKDLIALADQLRQWGRELGFHHIGITDADLSGHEPRLRQWLADKFHGEMAYMAERADMRAHPEQLLPGTVRVISARMDYLPGEDEAPERLLEQPEKAYVSRYALGRDYHKLMRKRLSQLAKRIEAEAGGGHYRALVDSAPVLERALAEKAGLGWIGKNSMLIKSDAGSWFFLGEIYTDLPLPVDPPQETGHCGSCTACLEVCPTGAIVAPYRVDARRCISYLTIELKGSIPEHLRPLIGNRIFGCDDCQLCCPWNKFAQVDATPEFQPRDHLAHADLLQLFAWTEEEFLKRTEGSALRRIGHARWLRNIAVALGNAPASEDIVRALEARAEHSDPMVREHVAWALARQSDKPRATD